MNIEESLPQGSWDRFRAPSIGRHRRILNGVVYRDTIYMYSLGVILGVIRNLQQEDPILMSRAGSVD